MIVVIAAVGGYLLLQLFVLRWSIRSLMERGRSPWLALLPGVEVALAVWALRDAAARRRSGS